MKWVMHNRGEFTAEQDGYEIIILMGGFMGYYWEITKDNKIVTASPYHKYPFTRDELNAKVSAERCLNKILTTPPVNH